MDEPVKHVILDDGRTLAYLDGGDADGVPVIGLHGTPGCRLSRVADDGVYARAGVRYLTPDRAGYGRSSRHPGRSVADEASDVLALADALGFERFAVVGGSGGGPHALACAALLPHRVTRVGCQSSVAPVGTGGMTRRAWVEGMADDIAAELRWADSGEATLVERVRERQRAMEESMRSDPALLLGEGMSEGDRAFLTRPEAIERFSLIVAEQCVDDVGGWVDDSLAFARPWGFNLAAISVPVLITHGLHDASTPIAHGRWLAARIRTAETRFSDTGGHLPEDHESEIAATMAWLRGT